MQSIGSSSIKDPGAGRPATGGRFVATPSERNVRTLVERPTAADDRYVDLVAQPALELLAQRRQLRLAARDLAGAARPIETALFGRPGVGPPVSPLEVGLELRVVDQDRDVEIGIRSGGARRTAALDADVAADRAGPIAVAVAVVLGRVGAELDLP